MTVGAVSNGVERGRRARRSSEGLHTGVEEVSPCHLNKLVYQTKNNCKCTSHFGILNDFVLLLFKEVNIFKKIMYFLGYTKFYMSTEVVRGLASLNKCIPKGLI